MTKTKLWLLLILAPIVFFGMITAFGYGVMSYGATKCEKRFGVQVGAGSITITGNGNVLLLYGIKDQLLSFCSFSLVPFGEVSKWIKINDTLLRDEKEAASSLDSNKKPD